MLTQLVEQHPHKLHILCTSRDEIDIREVLDRIATRTVRLEEEDVNKDIKAYIESCFEHHRLGKLPTDLKVNIKAKVADGAHGM